MRTRRDFIRKTGKGILYSSVAIPGMEALSATDIAFNAQDQKNIRIGIIGAENSHTRGFGKLFNIDRKFPGVEVVYVWGETEEFARDAMERGGIPNMVRDPREMLGRIDALIVDHRHAKYHLEAAIPFVEAGIPTFIDKPFCYRVEEGKEFLALAREYGTPVTSYSSIAHSDSTFDMKEQVEELGEIGQVIRYGPVDLDSKYGGVFFYGVHLVQPLLYIFGEDVERVRVNREGTHGNASLVFSSGLFATLVFKRESRGWDTFIETRDGMIELQSRVEEKNPPRHYSDMVEMFRTGKEPRSHKSILHCVAVLEALEKSASSGTWEKVSG